MQDVNKHITKIVNTADIQCLLGVSQRTARRRMADMKAAYGKKRYQLVKYEEFVNYYGLA